MGRSGTREYMGGWTGECTWWDEAGVVEIPDIYIYIYT